MAARLILLSVTMLFMAGFAEVALRLVLGPPVVWRYPQESYVDDAEIGYRLAPNQTAFTHDSVFETNEAGIRAEVHRPGKAPGVRRLLALGDSQTAGDGLTLDETWPAQLSARLDDATPDATWEVLNAGLSGSCPWHFVRLLRRLDATYAIDGVAIALYVNDVVPDSVEPTALVSTNTSAHRVIYALKRSALFTALWRTRGPIQQLWNPSPGAGYETRILTGEPDPGVEEGWRAVEGHLAEIRRYTRARGLGLWLVVLPRRDQVDGSLPETAYNDRAMVIAQRLDIPAVNVLEPMQTAFETHGGALFIPWDGHNTALANEVVSRELAELIRAGED